MISRDIPLNGWYFALLEGLRLCFDIRNFPWKIPQTQNSSVGNSRNEPPLLSEKKTGSVKNLVTFWFKRLLADLLKGCLSPDWNCRWF